ncbi:MAG TPA: lyase [Candidatus Limnocylindria bacterium]|nr:lyase [Candidatus Limnocylindria bacterium]
MTRSLLAALVLLTACTQPSAAPAATPSATPGRTPGAATTAPARVPPASATTAAAAARVQEYAVARGSGPHDVAPAADGGVWYTGQRNGTLGHLDPATGKVREIPLGRGSSPHGVIVDRNGVAWVTDSGQNAMVSVDPRAGDKVTVYPLPAGTPNVNLNTSVIDKDGAQWFTGQNGWFGRLDPDGRTHAFQAPRGRGPYGITTTPDGSVYYASLAASYVGRIRKETGGAEVLEPPTRDQGARRVWSDSTGSVWVSEYNAGQVARYDPRTSAWKEWKLPGAQPLAYSVYVDERDVVWLTDFAAHAIVSFDPATEAFTSYPYPANGNVRQQHGRPGEVWGALSSLDRLIVVRTR